MTTSKTLMGLMIVAGGLVFYLYQAQSRETEQNLLITALSAETSAVDALTKVVVSDGEQTFVMQEQPSGWTLNEGFYVRMDSLSDWIQALKNARLMEAKTANPDNFPSLSLTEDDLRVRLYQKQQLVADIILGQTSSTPGARFVRYADQQQSWLASELNDLQSSQETWQLAMIFDVPESQVQAIEWTADETLNLIRDSDQWQLAGETAAGQSIAQGQLVTLAAAISGFRIQDAIASNSPPEPLRQSFVFGLAQGRKITLAVYGHEDEAVIKVSDSAQPERYEHWQFTVPDYKLSTLLMNQSDIFASETENGDQPEADESATGSS